jgi:uncharacterized protein YjbJ (UPF0337 family)
MLSKNEIKGKGKQIGGAIKARVGEMTNNPGLEAKGEAKRLEGKIQEKAAKAFRKIDEAVEKADKAISRNR